MQTSRSRTLKRRYASEKRSYLFWAIDPSETGALARGRLDSDQRVFRASALLATDLQGHALHPGVSRTTAAEMAELLALEDRASSDAPSQHRRELLARDYSRRCR